MRNALFIFHTLITRLVLKTEGVSYGKSFNTHGFPIIFKDKRSYLKIGNNVTLTSNTLANLIGISQRTILVAKEGGSIEIGNNTGISGATIHSLKRIKLGSNILVGANTKIIDHDFHPVDTEARLNDIKGLKPREEILNAIKKEEIIIHDNVFIGVNSIILRGTHIGENTIIGAGSVVKGDFPADCVIAGNPAKIVKHIKKK